MNQVINEISNKSNNQPPLNNQNQPPPGDEDNM